MRAYFKVIDFKGVEHTLSCTATRFGFNEDTAMGYVLKHYFNEPNDGIKDIRFVGRFNE